MSEKKYQIVKSQAGTSREYLAIQLRARDDAVHIQGRGPSLNRPYGFAVDVDAPDEVISALLEGSPSLESMAGTGALYYRAQIAPPKTTDEDAWHIQVVSVGGLGHAPYRRHYGMAFDVVPNEKVERVLLKAVLNGLQ